MKSAHHDFNDEIDWSVFKKQQTVPDKFKGEQASQFTGGEPEDSTRQDMPLGRDMSHGNVPMVDTFLGKMPDTRGQSQRIDMNNPEMRKQIDEMINAAAGGPGMKLIGEGAALAKPIIAKGAQKTWDYFHPEKAAEEFRSSLGAGTSSENIAELSNRAQFAKKSAQEEALIPKRELYSQEGKSDVYDVNKAQLPEGNLSKFAKMIAPEDLYSNQAISKMPLRDLEIGMEQKKADALSKAIAKYRKTGDIEHFTESAEDIFNIPELGEKAASKIEDVLSMPTKRESAYFRDEDVTMPYSKKGNLMTRHSEYEDNPTMNNYQDLRSAITTQMRKLKGRAKTDDVAAEKYDQMKSNLKNLDKDANRFIETLPQNMQNLDKEFRQKYADYAGTYTKGEKETGASLTLRRLAEGRHDLVDDSAIQRLFTKPTASDKKAILEMGQGAGRNAIYSALQRVKPGDAKGMAETLLELKRTKGFDSFITPEMETWANNMIKQTKRAGLISTSLKVAGGMGAGSLLAGPFGAALGAAIPLGKEYGGTWGKILASKLKK